jgi:hypothetical protein
MTIELALNLPQFYGPYDDQKMRILVEEIERLHAALTRDVSDTGSSGSVDSFNGRVGVVVPLQADYDSFFLTSAEGDAAYSPIGHTHAHGTLTDIGTNTHAQIDTHLGLVNEHIDWSAAAAGTIHTDNYIENVPTSLSAGTVNGTSYGITSDGGADDIVLPVFNSTEAGLVPASGGSATDFLAGDGNWSAITIPIVNPKHADRWNFSTTIGTPPGTNEFRFNSATPSAVTAIQWDDTATSGVDGGGLIGQFTDGDMIYIYNSEDWQDSLIYRITGIVSDNLGWWNAAVTWESGTTLPANATEYIIEFDSPQLSPGTVAWELPRWNDTTKRWVGTGVDLTVNSSVGGQTTVETSSSVLILEASSQVRINTGTTFYGEYTNNNSYIAFSNPGFKSIGTGLFGGDLVIDAGNGNNDLVLSSGSGLRIVEKASAHGSTAGRGQIWVKTATPNELWFTNDAGTDFQLGLPAGAGIEKFGTPSVGQLAVWSGTNELEGTDQLTWGSGTLTILDGTLADSVAFSHDGVDFNIVGTTTADINITGITSISAGTVDANFDVVTGTNLNISDWDTAFGWGDHSGTYLPLAGGSMSGVITGYAGGTTNSGALQTSGATTIVRAQGYSTMGSTYSASSTFLANNAYVDNADVVSDQFRHANTHSTYGHTIYTQAGGVHTWYGNNNSVTADAVVSKVQQMQLSAAGALSVTGAVTGSNLNVSNWDTAFGWGDHAGLYLGLSDQAASSTLAQVNTSSLNADYKVTFALTTGDISGTYSMMMDSAGGFTFNPSTDELKVAILTASGVVSGSNINDTNWDTAFGWGDHAGLYALAAHTHLLAAGATDVTATAAEVNLLDLAALTAGWALTADGAAAASWKQIAHSTLSGIGSNTHAQIDTHIADSTIHLNEAAVDARVSALAVLLSGADQALLGTYRSTNDTNAHGANFSVNTSTKTAAEYAYEVLRSSVTVGGFLLDGSLESQDLDVTGNITVSGTVDGRDVALDGSTQDSHIADSTIHFTEASLALPTTYLALDASNSPLTGSLRIDSTLFDLNNSGAATATTMLARNSAGGMSFNINATTGNAQLGQISGAGAAEDVWVHMTRNGQVELRYDNSAKFATTNTGVDVTGNIVVSGNVDGRDVASDGSTQDSHIADSTIHFTQGAISIPLSQISDVTATAAEVNLLDLAGLTAGWVLSADTATTASWKAPAAGGGTSPVGSMVLTYNGAAGGDPGAGQWTSNSTTITSHQWWEIDDLDDAGNPTSNILQTMLDTGGGYCIIQDVADNSHYEVFSIDTVVNNTGYWRVNVTPLHGTSDTTTIATSTPITFTWFTSAYVPVASTGSTTFSREFLVWNDTDHHWEPSGTSFRINPAGVPTGGRIQLATTSGFNTASPQIDYDLGVSQSCLMYLNGSDATQGIYTRGDTSASVDVFEYGARTASTNTPLFRFESDNQITVLAGGDFRFAERAASPTFEAGHGYLWVKTATPNTLWFTDDTGGEFQLGVSGGGDVTKVGTPVDNQIGVWTGDGTLEGDANFLWSGSTLTLTSTNSVTMTPSASTFGINAGSHSGIRILGLTEADADGLTLADGMLLRFEDTAQANDWTVSNTGIGGAAAGLVWQCDTSTGHFEIQDSALRISNTTTGTDYLQMSHDDVDFNFSFAGTADLNITGITSIAAGTVDADFDAITATSYGGIAEANLLSRIVNEGITGEYDFRNANGITISDPTLSSLVRHSSAGSTTTYRSTFSGFTHWTIFNGITLSITDTTGADAMAMVHDGVDFNSTFTQTTDWNISGLTDIYVGATNIRFDNTQGIYASNTAGNTNLDLDAETSATGLANIRMFRNGATSSGGVQQTWYQGNSATTFARMAWGVDNREGLSLVNNAALHMEERASADTATAAYGQLWVKTATPNQLWFTPDDGNDVRIDPSVSEINGKTASYQLIYSDRGKTVRFTGATASKVCTIPANGTTAFPIGTMIGIENDGSVTMTIAITTDTLTWSKDNTTGTRTLAAGASCVIKKVASTSWKIAGSALVT